MSAITTLNNYMKTLTVFLPNNGRVAFTIGVPYEIIKGVNKVPTDFKTRLATPYPYCVVSFEDGTTYEYSGNPFILEDVKTVK